MVKKISTTDARASFGDLLNSVYYTREPVIVEKKGRPVAVIISPDLFQHLQDENARDWAIIEAAGARNVNVDPDELMADVTTEVEAVRQGMAAERRAH